MAKKFELVEVDGMFGLLSEKMSYAPEGDYQVVPARIGSEGQIGKLQKDGNLMYRGDFITKEQVPFDYNGVYEPCGKTHYLGKRLSLEQFEKADRSVFIEQMDKFKTKNADLSSSNYSSTLSGRLEKAGESAVNGYRKLEKAESKLEKEYMEYTINTLDARIPGFRYRMDYFTQKSKDFFNKIFKKAEQKIEASDDDILLNDKVGTRDLAKSVEAIKNFPESPMDAVRKNPSMLKQIKDQTPEICMAAISKDYRALSLVREQTPIICLTAVKIDGNALQFVREQTPQICMEAVKQVGGALRFVKEQTPELCAEAVKQDPLALKYVKSPSQELCVNAVLRNRNAISFVPESFLPVVNRALSHDDKIKIPSKMQARPSINLER